MSFQLTWLGYEINEQVYSPKFLKIEAIESLKPPKTFKTATIAYGFFESSAAFYPRFTHLYSAILAIVKIL